MFAVFFVDSRDIMEVEKQGEDKMVKIERVAENSLADCAGIKSGDILISINGHEINDVLDYRFYLADKLKELLEYIENKT